MTISFRRGMAISGASLLLWGCGTFPLARVYVLGDPGSPAAGVRDEAGLPHIDLKAVSVPDYLDTTEMMRRTASNEVVTSSTGRWGERISVGITRALADDLARRLPNVVIESRGVFEPSRRLLVAVERFEIGEDGRCTLAARWRVTASNDKVHSDSEQGTFIAAMTSRTDAAAASAMTSAIDQLASRIAITLTRDGAAH